MDLAYLGSFLFVVTVATNYFCHVLFSEVGEANQI